MMSGPSLIITYNQESANGPAMCFPTGQLTTFVVPTLIDAAHSFVEITNKKAEDSAPQVQIVL